LIAVHRFWELFGVRRPISNDSPPQAGDYDHALHVDHPETPSILLDYMGKADRDLVAQSKLSARSSSKRGEKHLEYDRFTWYSLVVVGIIFTVALNQYLVEVNAAPGVHILAVAAPLILLALYIVLLRSKRSYSKDKGGNRIPVKDTGD
jgi:energy-converting hydrogenase Eha subunit C